MIRFRLILRCTMKSVFVLGCGAFVLFFGVIVFFYAERFSSFMRMLFRLFYSFLSCYRSISFCYDYSVLIISHLGCPVKCFGFGFWISCVFYAERFCSCMRSDSAFAHADTRLTLILFSLVLIHFPSFKLFVHD